MIEAAIVTRFGIVELDENGFSEVNLRDGATGLLWVLVVHVEPGGPSTTEIVRCDPGTMGRSLFSFRTTPRDGRHHLSYVTLNGSLLSTGLPALPALCEFTREARLDLDAGRVPDLRDLASRHLGLVYAVPEVTPGTGFGYVELRWEQGQS